MKNLKQYICTKEFTVHIEVNEIKVRIKFNKGEAYYGSYDFDNIDLCRGFILLKINEAYHRVYIPSGNYWIEHLKFVKHVHENIIPQNATIVKRKRISKSRY